MRSLPSEEDKAVRAMIAELWPALDGPPDLARQLRLTGEGSLASVFAVSDFAAAAIATAGLALAEWSALCSGNAGKVVVDRRLASLWFGCSIAPQGWQLPPTWEAIAGDYATADGWIRLHTNAPHHRDAALAVLDRPADRALVAAATAGWRADDLEAAIVARGGCAAAMRSLEQWRAHPQGRSVAGEPLMHMDPGSAAAPGSRDFGPERPLAGIRVLDLTRVLAGPVATRFLAGFGADVLRVDPLGWDEGAVIPEVTLGKRCARLDLKPAGDQARFVALLQRADILVHGYRPDALERLGLGAEFRAGVRPGLIDVSLCAYGWSGPWAGRRGFDSLAQMSCGLAEAGMRQAGAGKPVPLPVQALDHGAGYLMAAAALRGLVVRHHQRRGSRWRTSLARLGGFLAQHPGAAASIEIGRPREEDYAPQIEPTAWGPARRLRPPLGLGAMTMDWPRPAGELGAAAAFWLM